MFDEKDYIRASMRLDIPVHHVKAVSLVESSGETFWTIDEKQKVPVRFEAHWFGRLTDYRFNVLHPDLSSHDWNPNLAARTKAGAWDQVERAKLLDSVAALSSTSWGGFQVMGFHWQRLRYNSVQSFVDSMSSNGDDGQMDAFCAFVEADRALHASLRIGAWMDVERRYNGGGYGGLYAEKMRKAAEMFERQDAPLTPRVMVRGMKGADVVELQAALGILADGDFGPMTESSVKMFQLSHPPLVPDGKVGVMTRSALNI